MKEADFYIKMKDNIQCQLCPRNCLIGKDKLGFCGVRKNINGKLYSLVYGKLKSAQIDPIEKKPFYHFHPGSKVFSISTVGCNFKCKFCCNYHLSQIIDINFVEINPDEVVRLAIKGNSDGLAYTYNEPTVFFEYARDIARIAKKEGLYNIFVTNGYINIPAINEISKYIDGVVIDIKGSLEDKFLKEYCSVKNGEKILESIIEYSKKGVHLEITDLIVPKIGDDLNKVEILVKWVYDNLGPDTPFHFIGFFPSYKCLDIDYTSSKFLKKCWNIGKKYLNYVYAYTSTDPGNKMNNTYCPDCGELLLERFGCSLIKNNLAKEKCPNCGKEIPGVFIDRNRRN
ncbi:MAG: AmmeMemoRadiSam system radical SAM enzyme [Candidatus Aenigmatarchaeota archaeon]